MPLRMLVSRCELIQPLRRDPLANYHVHSAVVPAAAIRLREPWRPGLARVLQAANDAIETTKLQWFVLNPLEELLMSQRARLVLDEGDRAKREAERARREGLLERVARVEMFEPRVREHPSGLLKPFVPFREGVDVHA